MVILESSDPVIALNPKVGARKTDVPISWLVIESGSSGRPATEESGLKIPSGLGGGKERKRGCANSS